MPPLNSDSADKDLQAVLKKISSFPAPFNDIGAQLHHTIINAGPKIAPRIWYGMPGYAAAKSKPVFIFFRVDDGVMSFGISEKATVAQESNTTLKPCAWFLDEIDEATLGKISDLVRTAFSD